MLHFSIANSSVWEKFKHAKYYNKASMLSKGIEGGITKGNYSEKDKHGICWMEEKQSVLKNIGKKDVDKWTGPVVK